ncbi:TetR family transcriptional regulator [Melghiribacillus thermohalophilus]|uniref:TetR family transcriptional regulator n=1 Tax=Melghiribacillus thermohalophilus TaxID=1324956 RepID=A0A4R3MVD7_9BACI|nr:TetR/AcrR family transcriptional regulator [Melghiribacillus thermohalophilus]TCT19341.1 TetR family transcriptional regulator [Melghiribacillus thermohalophilus]
MKDTPAKLDRRVRRSKKALQESLIQLMKEKDFKEITVTEIVHHADLNRGTFYKHFQYKEDLLREMMDEVMNDLVASYREPYKDGRTLKMKNLTSSAVRVFDHVYKYSSFYTLLFKSNSLVDFQMKIGKVLRDLALKDLDEYAPDPKINREIHASYRVYAIIGMIIEWVNSDFKYSSRYMAEQLVEILKLDQKKAAYKPRVEGE